MKFDATHARCQRTLGACAESFDQSTYFVDIRRDTGTQPSCVSASPS
jgi:hypothetical protein